MLVGGFKAKGAGLGDEEVNGSKMENSEGLSVLLLGYVVLIESSFFLTFSLFFLRGFEIVVISLPLSRFFFVLGSLGFRLSFVPRMKRRDQDLPIEISRCELRVK